MAEKRGVNVLHYSNDYRRYLKQVIEALPGEVFARGDLTSKFHFNPMFTLGNDFFDISSNRGQLRLNRALKAFMEEGLIMKIGHNLYAKAQKIEFNDKIHIVLKSPFEYVAVEALNKLGIKWEPDERVQAYNRGESTQVPAIFSVQLKSRYRGNITAGRRRVFFEGR